MVRCLERGGGSLVFAGARAVGGDHGARVRRRRVYDAPIFSRIDWGDQFSIFGLSFRATASFSRRLPLSHFQYPAKIQLDLTPCSPARVNWSTAQ
jgi:hypothetical protein